MDFSAASLCICKVPYGKKRFIEKLFTLFTFEFNHLNTMY